MFSVASLLNPVMMDQEVLSSQSLTPTHQIYKSLSSSPSSASIRKQNQNKSGNLIPKLKIRGNIYYPPYEELDDQMTLEVKRFHVKTLGKISENPAHIPYNSGKKNFLEKTGCEGFEVFQYVFKVPWSDNDYTVMWDYITGLVRITPFFKCYNYNKTTPAKMLAHNPGLKEITHSITGGALMAQGYWMPFNCAHDICATFCHQIAPALVPIFGPSFPSVCIPPEAPGYAKMVISPNTIAKATMQAEATRLQFRLISAKNTTTPPSSPEACHILKTCRAIKNPNTECKSLSKKHVNSYLIDNEITPPLDIYLSPVTLTADQKHNQNAIYVLSHLNKSQNKQLSLLTPINTPKIQCDVSNLHVTPNINLWHPVQSTEGSSLNQNPKVKTDDRGNFNTEKWARGCINTRNLITSDLKMQDFEIGSEPSFRSEETKAAYSLISLSLKYSKGCYEGNESGDGPHTKRRRATSA